MKATLGTQTNWPELADGLKIEGFKISLRRKQNREIRCGRNRGIGRNREIGRNRGDRY